MASFSTPANWIGPSRIPTRCSPSIPGAIFNSLLKSPSTTLKSKVRELVRLQLSTHRCTADRLAEQMGCDRRTLHRRLAHEQVTFDAIVESVRSNLAVQILQNRQVSLVSAADMLGFSGASAFSRWFLGSFGKRPSDWRKEEVHSIGSSRPASPAPDVSVFS